VTEVASGDKARSESGLEAYAPSWVDLFTAWVDRQPGPSWLAYLGVGLILLLVQAAVTWAEGAYPIGTLSPIVLFYAGAMPFFLALLHGLDNIAVQALTTLRPALTTNEEEYSALRYQFTTLPARATIFVSLIILIASTLVDLREGSPISTGPLAGSPLSATVQYLIYKITWWVFSALLYHTVRQLRLIDRVYTRHTRINLFRASPLYAFSRLTALTAVGLIGPPYIFFALTPGAFSDPIALAIGFLFLSLAVAIFVWPVLGLHRLMGEEKQRLLDEPSLRLEAAIAELHRQIDSGAPKGLDDLQKVISIMENERSILDRIPTWPWKPETLRLLITALLLPLVMWVTQLVLRRVLGP
jgi:hypothetical protein